MKLFITTAVKTSNPTNVSLFSGELESDHYDAALLVQEK
jgi:hypothetical protein